MKRLACASNVMIRAAVMLALLGATLDGRHLAQAAPRMSPVEGRPVVNHAPGHAQGRALFKKYCAMCHGLDGTGGMGVPLNLQSFLVVADEDYLIRSMIHGRPTRGMPSFTGSLPAQELKAIARFVKSWQRQPSIALPAQPIRGDARKGARLFATSCVICHGVAAGGGKMPGDGHDIDQTNLYSPVGGPGLVDPGFLNSASDSFIKATIIHGRAGTRMNAYLKGRRGRAEFDENEVDDIVAYLRSFQP